MAHRWLHCIDQDGLQIFASGRDGLRPVHRFAASEDGLAAFRKCLREQPLNGLHAVFVDLPDEGFHCESVPWAWGRDRRDLLQRRMSQHFPGTPYVTTLTLGRERDGRRDETVLYAALTRPGAIAPWLNAMQQHPLTISSLRTPPLLLPALLTRLKIDAPSGLLIVLSGNGVRQIYFDRERLRFSRLSPPLEGAFAHWAPDCLREARKTYQYLCAQGCVERGSPLHVRVLLHRDDIAAFMQYVPAEGPLGVQAVDIADVLSRTRPRLNTNSSDSRPLLLNLALREVRGAQLAPDQTLSVYRRRRALAVAISTGAIGFAACAGLALELQLTSASLRRDAAHSRAVAAQYAARYDETLHGLAASPEALAQAKAVVRAYEDSILPAPAPQAMLTTLSHVLHRFADVELDRLEWRLEDGEPAFAQGPPASHLLNVTAHLPIAADPRVAAARVRAFISALQRAGGGRVDLVSLSVEPEAGQVLRSDANEGPPQFTLRWKLAGEAR